MNELHFIRPWLLATIPLGIALAWLYWRRGGGRSGVWQALVDPPLRRVMLAAGEQTRRGAGSFVLAAAAITLAGLALAGPAWERQMVPVSRSGDAMVIALDLSRSMEATDLAPSRLARAKLKLKDILRERRGGDTALVVFSANAFVVTPLTDDVDTIDAQIPALSSSLMPSRGSYPHAGLEKAQQLLAQAGVERGRILLITDGGNLPPALTAARRLRDAGHTVAVLGVGTEQGGPIPAGGSGFVTDGRGRIALPQLPVGELQRLGKAGGGGFALLSSDDRDLRALSLRSGVGARAESEDSERSIERWLDRGPWLAVVLLPLFALAFRRGGYVFAGALAAVSLWPAAPTAQAASWTELFQNRDQRALAALEDGQADEARALFDDPAWRASAAYRAGDFAASAEQFAGLDGDDAAYNRATALARAGDIDGAIAGYEALLARAPDHEDARYNLELLKSLPDDQQSGDSEGQSGQPSDGESGQGEQSGEGDGSSSDQSQSGEQNNGQPSEGDDSASGEGADGDPRESGSSQEDLEAIQRAMSEAEAAETGDPVQAQAAATQAERDAAEQAQALEQWLRRIPDDPGGLLRKKFRLQYQRRETDQDGNQLYPDDRTEPW